MYTDFQWLIFHFNNKNRGGITRSYLNYTPWRSSSNRFVFSFRFKWTIDIFIWCACVSVYGFFNSMHQWRLQIFHLTKCCFNGCDKRMNVVECEWYFYNVYHLSIDPSQSDKILFVNYWSDFNPFKVIILVRIGLNMYPPCEYQEFKWNYINTNWVQGKMWQLNDDRWKLSI